VFYSPKLYGFVAVGRGGGGGKISSKMPLTASKDNIHNSIPSGYITPPQTS